MKFLTLPPQNRWGRLINQFERIYSTVVRIYSLGTMTGKPLRVGKVRVRILKRNKVIGFLYVALRDKLRLG